LFYSGNSQDRTRPTSGITQATDNKTITSKTPLLNLAKIPIQGRFCLQQSNRVQVQDSQVVPNKELTCPFRVWHATCNRVQRPSPPGHSSGLGCGRERARGRRQGRLYGRRVRARFQLGVSAARRKLRGPRLYSAFGHLAGPSFLGSRSVSANPVKGKQGQRKGKRGSIRCRANQQEPWR